MDVFSSTKPHFRRPACCVFSTSRLECFCGIDVGGSPLMAARRTRLIHHRSPFSGPRCCGRPGWRNRLSHSALGAFRKRGCPINKCENRLLRGLLSRLNACLGWNFPRCGRAGALSWTIETRHCARKSSLRSAASTAEASSIDNHGIPKNSKLERLGRPGQDKRSVRLAFNAEGRVGEGARACRPAAVQCPVIRLTAKN
jgi:hypothetical protein